MVTLGCAPACASTRSARAAPASGCGTRKRQRSSGSATVADRPTVVSLRRQREQPRQAERQKIAALGRDQRMQFVKHDTLERAEEIRRVGRRQQQRELLRRGEQDIGRITALALALGGGRVAGAGFQPHVEAHLLHRDFQVARDVDRQRFERRDIERVQALRAARMSRPVETSRRGAAVVSYNSTSVGRKPASVLPPPVGAISSTERPSRALASNSS